MTKRLEAAAFRESIARLKEVFTRVEAFGHAAVHEAGLVRALLAHLKPNALPIGPYDALLAEYVRALGAVRVTDNAREFARAPERGARAGGSEGRAGFGAGRTCGGSRSLQRESAEKVKG